MHAAHKRGDAHEHALEPVRVHGVLPVVDGVEGGDEAHPGPLEDQAGEEHAGGVVVAVVLAAPEAEVEVGEALEASRADVDEDAQPGDDIPYGVGEEDPRGPHFYLGALVDIHWRVDKIACALIWRPSTSMRLKKASCWRVLFA